jgi:hypothetical protein
MCTMPCILPIQDTVHGSSDLMKTVLQPTPFDLEYKKGNCNRRILT